MKIRALLDPGEPRQLRPGLDRSRHVPGDPERHGVEDRREPVGEGKQAEARKARGLVLSRR